MSEAKAEEVIEVVEEEKAREVLFFELEMLATTGRESLFKAVKKVMKSKDMDVTEGLFSQCCMTPRPGASIQALIANSGRNLTTGDQLTDQAENAIKKFFTGEAELNAALPAVIKAAQKMDIEVVAISAWSEDIATALMTKLGLDTLGVQLAALDCTDALFPRADHWLRLLKQREQDMIPVIALVSSAASCRGALTAGATCVAIPDALTSFEDFSGAKIILDSLDEMKPKELLALVSRD